MSETLIYYLANTLMRGGVIVALLLFLEFLRRRKLVFAGGRRIFIFALLLILMPLEKISFSRGENDLPASAYCIEVPDWNVLWNRAEIAKSGVDAPSFESSPEIPAVSAVSETVSPAVPAVPAASGWRWTLFDVLAIIYLASVLLLSAKQLRHYFIWRNRIRRCIAITGGRVFDVFRESKRLTGLERYPIRLLDSGDMLPVAACFGTLRNGAVLCPLAEYGKYTESELRMILIHELEHLRRKDNPVAFFLMMLSNLLFVNPFVRIILSRWAMIAEFDCDEKVKTTLGLDRQGMAQYAGLLLASQVGKRANLPVCGIGASAANLKLRIQEFVMNRTKSQLLRYFSGICALFILVSFLMPELRADTREPIDPAAARNLPAKTRELVYFNAAALDRAGFELLEKAAAVSGNLDWKLWKVFSQMLVSEKNKGRFYLAEVPGYGQFMLLKNGIDPDEVIISAGMGNQGMTARKMPGGYFALIPAGKELPALGLPEELKQKIAANPEEALRSCKAGEPDRVSIANHNGTYTLSAIQKKGKAEMTPESIAAKAVSYAPEEEKEAKKAFVQKNLKFSAKTLDGADVYDMAFPLNAETLTFWSDFIRKAKEEQAAADAPKVIALSPANGATDVDPNLKEIKVTFDRPMSTTSWSFCQTSDYDFPETPSKPSFDQAKTTITLPVRLVPGRTYNIFLNSPPYTGFRSAKGGVLQSVHYTFTTAR